MKRSILILSTVIAYFMFTSVSCEEPEPFTNIKAIETQIYNEVKAYREANGVSGNFVQQFVMVQEAQIHSAKMSFDTIGVDTTGISVHWSIIHDKIGGTNDITLVQKTLDNTASAILENWTSDSLSNALILDENLSQCGVGVENNDKQENFVTMMMMLAE
jgi:hypothetical protein